MDLDEGRLLQSQVKRLSPVKKKLNVINSIAFLKLYGHEYTINDCRLKQCLCVHLSSISFQLPYNEIKICHYIE